MGAVPIKKGYFGGRRESDCASLAPLTSLMVTRGLTVRAHIPGWPSRTTRATHASRPWRLLEKRPVFQGPRTTPFRSCLRFAPVHDGRRRSEDPEGVGSCRGTRYRHSNRTSWPRL